MFPGAGTICGHGREKCGRVIAGDSAGAFRPILVQHVAALHAELRLGAVAEVEVEVEETGAEGGEILQLLGGRGRGRQRGRRWARVRSAAWRLK